MRKIYIITALLVLAGLILPWCEILRERCKVLARECREAYSDYQHTVCDMIWEVLPCELPTTILFPVRLDRSRRIC